jgi:ureidoacrylate peracid hydrolase
LIDFDRLTTREVPLVPERAALLFVDVQNFCAHPEGGEFRGLPRAEFDAKYEWFFRHLHQTVLPNMQKLQAACRRAGVEVLYAVIESLTLDGRDRSLDYKITGFHVPKGTWDGKVLDAIAPAEDEIVLSKTSSNVFVSTIIDYVLRNLGKRQLVVSGLITDQCVESAVRDGCDLGYLVTLVTDACATYSPSRHEHALAEIKGYCRQVTTAQILTELEGGADP